LGWVEANRAKADCDGVLADLGYPLEGHPWPFTVERLPSPGTEGHVRVMDGWPDPVMSDTPSAYVINGSPLQMLVEGGFAYPEEVQEVEAAVRVVNRGLHLWDRRVRHRELTLLGQSRGFFFRERTGRINRPANLLPSPPCGPSSSPCRESVRSWCRGWTGPRSRSFRSSGISRSP
jgi:hypothetical protein